MKSSIATSVSGGNRSSMDRWFGRFDEGGATRGDPSRCVVLSAAAGEEAEQRENHDDDDDPDDDAEDAPPLVRTFLPSCFDGNPFGLAVSRQELERESAIKKRRQRIFV
jgi:hypothetical protein